MLLGFVSIIIGLLFGLISALIFKHFRSLTHSPVTEAVLLFIFAFMSYAISEAAEYSGIISLLTAGITMAHYTWYNLSPQGKTISSVTFSILGAGAEAFVFAFVGLCVFYYIGREEGDGAYVWSGSCIGWMTAIIIVGRIIAISIAQGCASMCRKKGE